MWVRCPFTATSAATAASPLYRSNSSGSVVCLSCCRRQQCCFRSWARRSGVWWQRSRWSKRIRRSCQHCSCGRAINLQGCAAACRASASDASAQKYTAVQRCTVAQHELAAEERTCAAATTNWTALADRPHPLLSSPARTSTAQDPDFFFVPCGPQWWGRDFDWCLVIRIRIHKALLRPCRRRRRRCCHSRRRPRLQSFHCD